MSRLCGFLYTYGNLAGVRPEHTGDATTGEVQHT
jgi:hypothetical protein